MVTRDEMELRYQSLAGLLAKNSSSKKVLVDATSYGMALEMKFVMLTAHISFNSTLLTLSCQMKEV